MEPLDNKSNKSAWKRTERYILDNGPVTTLQITVNTGYSKKRIGNFLNSNKYLVCTEVEYGAYRFSKWNHLRNYSIDQLVTLYHIDPQPHKKNHKKISSYIGSLEFLVDVEEE